MSMASTAYANWDIVVVSYNSERHLADWLDQPKSLLNRVVLIDNSSTDNSLSLGEQHFAKARSSDNRGLSCGNNLGASEGDADYVLFCNPDVRVKPEDLPVLAQHLDQVGGIVGPRLASSDGSPQANARRFPSVASQILRKLSVSLAGEYLWPVGPDEVSQVDWLMGAAIAIKREDLIRLHGWDESFFLYFEDVDFCARARKAGMPVWILGNLRWLHLWQQGSARVLSRSFLRHLRSLFVFYRKHPGMLVGRDG